MVRRQATTTYFSILLVVSTDCGLFQPPQSDRPAWSDITARLQNLRNLLSSERDLGVEQQTAVAALRREMGDQMAAFEAFDREMGNDMEAFDTANRGLDGRFSSDHFARNRRRADLEAHMREQSTSTVSEALPQNNTPPSLVRNRRRAVRPSERLQRYQRERIAQSGRTATLEAYVSPSTLSPAHPSLSASNGGDRQAVKRRKLEDGTYEEEHRTFSYGDSGQVFPGQLRLDLISCDGGEYSDPHTPVNSYPQSVLRDDTTVYCTKSNQCNLLFKHVGGMPFTLTKIVVKAPRSGYDAPIQEGLVFIAMEDDNLLDRTSHHDMRWSPRPRRYERRRRGLSGDSYRPSQEYMHSTRSPLRSLDRSRYLRDPTDVDEDPLLDTPLVPGFQVTVADPSDDEDALSSPLPRRFGDDEDYFLRSSVDRYRPAYGADEHNSVSWSNSSDSEGYDPEARPDHRTSSRPPDRIQRQQASLENALAHRNRMLNQMRAQQIREGDDIRDHLRDAEEGDVDRSRRGSPSTRSARWALGAATPEGMTNSRTSDSRTRLTDALNPISKNVSSSTESGPSTSRADVAPHARFFISRSKSSTAVKFDPPV
jgi:hypothetical protein